MTAVLPAPRRLEIDHRTMKLIVGVIAISLPVLTRALAGHPLESISASYYEHDWVPSIFIGFLFAIAAFLLAYNGRSTPEMVLSKIASAAALGVALFPCRCRTHDELIPDVHAVSAVTMFFILAYFCWEFLRRARDKGHWEAKLRAGIYAACAIAILASIAVLAFNGLLHGAIKDRVPYLTFYGETTGLVAFGISWLTASRVLPLVTRPGERFSPLRASNPE